MEIINKNTVKIKKEEALILLDIWENTDIQDMKLYGDFNDYLIAGKRLRELKNIGNPFTIMEVEEYFALSINLLTNLNLIKLEKLQLSKDK